MSKGSARRPTNEEAFQANFDRIFGKKKPTALNKAYPTKPGAIWCCPDLNKCSAPFCSCEVKLCNQEK